MDEIWKDIPGYEGKYQVSNLGRVKSLPRCVEHLSNKGNHSAHRVPGKILKPSVKACGHLQVQLFDGTTMKNCAVHRLVMLAFVGACPNGFEVCHNDSNPKNNSLNNLRYDTRSKNREDSIFMGNCGHQKLSVGQVREVRSKIGRGASTRELTEEYGISRQAIWDIKKGKTFRCVTN